MAKGQGLRLLALLALFHVCSAGFSCSGMGRRYCDAEAAEADECPETCLKKNCRKRKPTVIPQPGSINFKGGSFTFDDLVKKGLYQHVYISEMQLCVGYCWFKPWKAKCGDKDGKSCVALDCSHDKGNKVNAGNRFVGCHRDTDSGKKKKPFHKPTCKECKLIFKNACRGKGWKGVSNNADETGYIMLNDTEALMPSAAITTAVEKYIPFEAAPRSWQMMFLDEYNDSDSMAVSAVNVVLQFANAIEDLDEKLVVATIAEVAGVEEGQALLLHTYDAKEEYSRELYNETSNTTKTQRVVDYLLTVSVGIVAQNPEELAKQLRLTGNAIWSEAFAKSGNMTFLPRSLSAEIKHISAGMVHPDLVGSAVMVNVTALESGHLEMMGSVEPHFDEISSSAVTVASAGTVESQSEAFGIRSSAIIMASVAGAVISNLLL